MPIAVEDLDLHPHPKGKQILELFFGEAAKYRDTYVLPEHCQTAQVADDFINWVTNAIKAKELELYYHSSSAYSSLDLIRINYGMGSLYWFKRCEFDRGAFFYWIKDKNIISKLQTRGIKVKKPLIEAIEKFSMKYGAEKRLPLEAEPTIKPIGQKQKDSLVDDQDFTPNAQNWGQVTFCVLDGSELEITVKGKPFKGDVLISKKMPKYLYALLFNIVLKGGNFDKHSFPNLKVNNINPYLARLKEHLKRIFEINENPAVYNKKAKSFQCAFKTELDLKQKTFSPEANTPAGVPPPKTKSAKNFDSYQ